MWLLPPQSVKGAKIRARKIQRLPCRKALVLIAVSAPSTLFPMIHVINVNVEQNWTPY